MPAAKRKSIRVFTIGKKGRTFESFFAALREAGVKRVVDVRRWNTWEKSAGFTVKAKLPAYLEEQCGAEYVHELLLAPSPELLSAFRKESLDWPKYRQDFLAQLAERKVEEKLGPALFAVPTALLCACEAADRCHRSLVLDYLESKWRAIRLVPVHL